MSQTNTKTTLKKTARKRGTVTVGTDKGCLRLQFPSSVSQKIWGKTQKYKSLGLSDTPINRAVAEKIASQAQVDILSDNLDLTLERYNPHRLEKTSEKIEPKIPSLLALYQKYIETVIKASVAPSTYLRYSKYYLNTLNHCADAHLVKDAIKIRDTIRGIRTDNRTREILDVLFNLMEWAIRNEVLPKGTENPYRQLKQDVRGKTKYQKPKRMRENEINEDTDDYRGYSPEEARAIIEEFSQRGQPKGKYRDAVEFMFLTGCRMGECFGLLWGDVEEDYRAINFRHSHCRYTKENKALKTAHQNKSSRKFPCGERLKNLLIRRRASQNCSPKDFVFSDGKGEPINAWAFYCVWAGQAEKEGCNRSRGVIAKLMQEGKLEFYLKPYATRHSFITWQLKAGETPANVAKLAGNSPEIIYRHYVSADKDTKPTFEI
jgi:integrase